MKVYIGIDWSESTHAVCFMNEAGSIVQQMNIEHTINGFLELEKRCKMLGVEVRNCILGLETAHNILIDFLWDRQYTQVYVLPPQAVKSARGRYRQSGAKDDPGDARLIADLLRTDRHQYHPWQPGSPITRQIRANVSLVLFLTRNITRTSNRLRSILVRYFPAALNIFSSLDAPISLAFIQAFPSPHKAAQISPEQFSQFARQHHHTQPKKWAGCYARLQEPQPDADPAVVGAYAQQVQLLAKLLLDLIKAKKQTLKDLHNLIKQHPDHFIYASLPGAGELLQPGLLSKLGDDRHRFPSPAVLQAVAGTCPVTIRSGKSRRVAFRRTCDRDFRYIAQQWAKASINESSWAYAYFHQLLSRGLSYNHAYRCLANRWLSILWTLWQRGQPYDEAFHLSQRIAYSKPRP